MKLNLDYKKIMSEVITVSLVVIISAVAIISFIIISDQNVDIYKSNAKVDVMKGSAQIEEIMKILQDKSIEKLDINKLTDGAIEGIFSKIDDPYTRYLTPEEYNDSVNAGNEKYDGIGVHISRNPKTKEAVIISVMPNSPAKASGVLAGDVIYQIDGKDVDINNYYGTVDKIKGEPGSEIKLTLKRGVELVNLAVKRQKITPYDVLSEVIEGKIGYIKIMQFENNVYNQFKQEYTDLVENKKVKGLIIDVRDNPGGIVTETVKIADMLLKEGVILETVYRDSTKKVYPSDKKQIEIPLVVLVNENSASAAEILAGSIKDLKQGTLVGKNTFGKGIVQSIIKLSNGAGLSVTTAKYYTASGNEIHQKGIAPDIVIDNPIQARYEVLFNNEHDLQLKEAIRIINSKK